MTDVPERFMIDGRPAREVIEESARVRRQPEPEFRWDTAGRLVDAAGHPVDFDG